MSRYIEVNHSILEKAADDFDKHILFHNLLFREADENVGNMKSVWKGSDYEQYLSQWETLSDNDSTSELIVKALKDYSNLLRFSALRYKEAQMNAVNRVMHI